MCLFSCNRNHLERLDRFSWDLLLSLFEDSHGLLMLCSHSSPRCQHDELDRLQSKSNNPVHLPFIEFVNNYPDRILLLRLSFSTVQISAMRGLVEQQMAPQVHLDYSLLFSLIQEKSRSLLEIQQILRVALRSSTSYLEVTGM